MMDPQGSSTVTADTDYTEALESLVPPSRRDSVGREAPASPPAGPASDSQWREPTDRFINEIAKYFDISTTCRACHGRRGQNSPSNLVFCTGCGPAYKPIHHSCLRRDANHKPPSDTSRQHCREVPFKEYAFMRWLFDARLLDKSSALHVDDIKATWFGVPLAQPEAPYPQLYIWNRLRNLVSEAADAPPRQYPSLVSFVSPTGAGKSTLIRALIRMLEPVGFKDFDAPVPGGISEMFVSTSSDVHLYADPRTRVSKAPIYFADCEGHSGQADTVARRVISKAYRPTPARGGRSEPAGKPAYADRIAHHFETASHREDLRWGRLRYANTTSGQGDHAFRNAKTNGEVDPITRKLVVSELYPRLLYAFSDVVCFVQNDPRHSQGMFDTLFDWALQGHEKTLNQRVRPGLIIILNKSTELIHDALGSPEQATRKILDAYAQSARFKEMRARWAKRNRRVKTAEDLIHCYYYAFTVVSMPTYGSDPPVASQMAGALKELYAKIRDMSERIRKKRRSCNMDPDVSSFNSYLEYAAGKLARDYTTAVDLHQMQMSSGDWSLPTRFSEHMAQLMANMSRIRRLDESNERGGEAELVEEIIPFIASCIVTQVPQTDSKQEETERQMRIIADEARVGLQIFRDKSWRCEAIDPKTHRRCRNYWDGHEKVHQFGASARPAISPSVEDNLSDGQHESSYDGDKYMRLLWDAIHSISGGALDVEGTERRSLADTAQAVGVNLVQSQRTCLSCLSNCPTNTLPCRGIQHSICEACIKRYMRGYDSSWAHLTQCPLGCELWTTPWRIRVKPETAGPRILALDGGGIRGVVELKILARIEEEVGFGIKIQDLFDLAIGTSTGGIVALGVFEKGWTLAEAIQRFRDLASRAFEFRRALKLPLYSKFAVPFCAFKYKTAGIVGALQESFGDDFLFGQPRGSTQPQESDGMLVPSAQDQVKVAVVACLEGRNQPCLIANYSRNPLSCVSEQDILQREDEQANDFRTWQAARATSAAHTIFKPYYHEDTRRTYVDGAVVRNNPVQVAFDESQRIWPSCRPDIIISLGTGIMVDEGGKHVSAKNQTVENLKAVVPARILKKLETGFNMVESTLSCHRAWSDFQQSHIPDPRLRRNLHRIDVGIANEPPKLDDVSKIAGLIDRCDNYLAPGRGRGVGGDLATAQQLRCVARRLRASLFCFSVPLAGYMEGGTILGKIHCRLSAHSEGASSFLASGPVFRLREWVGAGQPDRFEDVHLLTGFDRITLSADARVKVSPGSAQRSIEVRIMTRGQEWEPISGF